MSEELALVPDQQGVPAEAETPAKKPRTDWWAEVRGIVWLILAVLGFHSFIAKPFYIPSESMLPGLLVGDQLVVSKFAYGWSYVSPTIPNPVPIFKDLVLHEPEESWGVQLPFIHGRVFGRLPERGDVVIVTPPGRNVDYIKRVIGLPGDRLQVKDGVVILNGVPVKRGPLHYVDIPDYGGVTTPDGETCDPGELVPGVRERAADGTFHCRLPIVTETLPNGRRYDTVELGYSEGDNYGPITVAAGHVFLMGDNRDRSADSRFLPAQGGLDGAVPWENIGGRAEFITHSLDGSATLNPATWLGDLRHGRAGTSLHPERVKP